MTFHHVHSLMSKSFAAYLIDEEITAEAHKRHKNIRTESSTASCGDQTLINETFGNKHKDMHV